MNNDTKNVAATSTSILLTKQWDDSRMDYQELSWRGFTIMTLKSKFAPDGAEFLPAKVLRDGRTIWAFDKNGDAKMAFLREYGDEPVIALTTKRDLLAVVFIADIGKDHSVSVKGRQVIIPARSFTEIALCKRELGEDMGRTPSFTNEEHVALRVYDTNAQAEKNRAEHEKRSDRLKQQEDIRQQRAAEQTIKINKILSRDEISCFTKDGSKPRRGKPVVGNEWECLKNGTFCVSVSSYDEKTGQYGELLESFRVRKDGARCSKQASEAVQATPVVTPKALELEAEDVQELTVGDQIRMVPIYTDIKPSSVPLSIPFAIRQGKVLTVYQRTTGGKLGTLGVVRGAAAA